MLTGNKATILTQYGNTRTIKLAKGTKQGDPLSGTLFNLFLELLIRIMQ